MFGNDKNSERKMGGIKEMLGELYLREERNEK